MQIWINKKLIFREKCTFIFFYAQILIFWTHILNAPILLNTHTHPNLLNRHLRWSHGYLSSGQTHTYSEHAHTYRRLRESCQPQPKNGDIENWVVLLSLTSETACQQASWTTQSHSGYKCQVLLTRAWSQWQASWAVLPSLLSVRYANLVHQCLKIKTGTLNY